MAEPMLTIIPMNITISSQTALNTCQNENRLQLEQKWYHYVSQKYPCEA